MFLNHPTDPMGELARKHLGRPAEFSVPVSWGFGLSTTGIFMLVFAVVAVAVLLVPILPSAAVAVLLIGPIGAVAIGTLSGRLGQGAAVIARNPAGLDEETPQPADDETGAGRRRAALVVKGSVTTGRVWRHPRRIYQPGTAVALDQRRAWWQPLRLTIGDDLYYVNPNYDSEVLDLLADTFAVPGQGRDDGDHDGD